MSIHDLAARGFERAAGDYEQGRPGYPEAVIACLVEALGIQAGATVLDLGARTDKLTRLLQPTGARLIAVEPMEAMRRKLAAPLAQAGRSNGCP